MVAHASVSGNCKQVVSEPFAGSTTSYFANGTVFVYVAQYGLDCTGPYAAFLKGGFHRGCVSDYVGIYAVGINPYPT